MLQKAYFHSQTVHQDDNGGAQLGDHPMAKKIIHLQKHILEQPVNIHSYLIFIDR